MMGHMFDSPLVVVNVLPAVPVETERGTVLVHLDPSERPEEGPKAKALARILGLRLPMLDLPKAEDTPSWGFCSGNRSHMANVLGYMASVGGDAFTRELPAVSNSGVIGLVALLRGRSFTEFDAEKYRLNWAQAHELERWLDRVAGEGLGLWVEQSRKTYH